MARKGRWWTCLLLIAAAAAWFASPSSAAADPPTPVHEGSPPNALCLICHSQAGLMIETGQGQERPLAVVRPLAFEASGHKEVACVDCHTAQSALPHLTEKQVVNGTTACFECHQDAYDSYLDSAHGTMVELGDTRAPTCTTCHGDAHYVQPIQQWTDHERARVCADCHQGAGPRFLKALSHQEPSPSFNPMDYFGGRFLLILTAAVLAFGIIHVELDMLRWLARRWRTRKDRGRWQST